MNSTIETDAAQLGQNFANKSADQAKSGIDGAASTLSSKVDSARQQSKPFIEQLGIAAGKVRDSATKTSDSIATFTKANPGKALVYAAASGALLLALFKALTSSKD